MKLWAPIASAISQSLKNYDSGESIQDIIGSFDAAWYRASTTSGVVATLSDLSGNGNHATSSDGPTVVTRMGATYMEFTYPADTVLLDWPMDGKTGTFGFASIHGAQVFTLEADAQVPRIQFIEAVFIEDLLDAGKRAQLLSLLSAKCPAQTQLVELLTTEYNHYWINRDDNPAGSFVMTFTDSQTAEAPPWDAPDFDTVLVTVDVERRGMRVVSADPSDVVEFVIDGYSQTQTTSILKNMTAYTGAEYIEQDGYIQGSLLPWSSYPSSGAALYSLAINGTVGGGMCGGIPALADIPSNITELFIIAPGVKWAQFDLSDLPATLQKLALAYITTENDMPVLSGLTLTHLDLRHTTFTAGSVPTLPLQLVFLDMENTNRTGLAPNPGQFLSMERYHFRYNALTGFDAPVTFNNATDYVNLEGNTMSSATVNAILAAFVLANPTTVGKKYKRLQINGTGMGAPTGQGILDKATIISRGFQCLTN